MDYCMMWGLPESCCAKVCSIDLLWSVVTILTPQYKFSIWKVVLWCFQWEEINRVAIWRNTSVRLNTIVLKIVHFTQPNKYSKILPLCAIWQKNKGTKLSLIVAVIYKASLTCRNLHADHSGTFVKQHTKRQWQYLVVDCILCKTDFIKRNESRTYI